MSHLASLLFRSESDSLDFKRDQYQFVDAELGKKSELLKDILAMANSWRDGTAYILIGVEEGIPAKVVGITNHIDDATLQQFVNSKTKRPIKFQYRREEIHGLLVGVIEIPVQARPFFLTKDYGPLKRNVVYLRRGSSTAEASPDEVLEMGATATSLRQDDLQLNFARPGHRETMGVIFTFSAEALEVDDGAEVPDHVPPANEGFLGHLNIGLERNNPDFYRELVERAISEKLFRLASITIGNTGMVAATNIRAEFSVPDPEGNWIFLETDDLETQTPRRTSDITQLRDFRPIVANRRMEPECRIKKLKDVWHLTFEFRDLQPGRTLWPALDFYVGAKSTVTLEMNGKVMADSLPAPLPCCLKLEATVKRTATTLDLIETRYEQRLQTGEPPFDFSGLRPTDS